MPEGDGGDAAADVGWEVVVLSLLEAVPSLTPAEAWAMRADITIHLYLGPRAEAQRRALRQSPAAESHLAADGRRQRISGGPEVLRGFLTGGAHGL